MTDSAPHPVPWPLRILATLLVIALVGGGGYGIWLWRRASLEAQAQPPPVEPQETIRAARARAQTHVRRTTAIGSVLALRSITLENELAGTVREIHLPVGGLVEMGALLVQFDVEVETAELEAQKAEARLAETLLGRLERARKGEAVSEADVDRARAELDVARAVVGRTEALIRKKTIRAPFDARVGLSDVHPGQYLAPGTRLTTLQSVDDAVHVDFAVPQDAAVHLEPGTEVLAGVPGHDEPLTATIVARDARIDPRTRNAMLRARLEVAAPRPLPGASVRIEVPVGRPRELIGVPSTALRKSPEGDHVFVIVGASPDTLRATRRPVRVAASLGRTVLLESGVQAGERVAAEGSFKLFEGIRVRIAGDARPSPKAGS